jgi:hypothetical protein
MTSEKQLLSPKQRKGLGYLLLVLGIADMLYIINSTWRGEEPSLSLAPAISLVIIGSVLLIKKNKN